MSSLWENIDLKYQAAMSPIHVYALIHVKGTTPVTFDILSGSAKPINLKMYDLDEWREQIRKFSERLDEKIKAMVRKELDDFIQENKL